MARAEACDRCGWDARVCLNCVFYSKNSYRECVEEQAELVKDKDKRNFCSYFQSNVGNGAASQSGTDHSNPLDQLFGGQDTPKTKSKLEEELDSFFKK
jgi:hypothetical protein